METAALWLKGRKTLIIEFSFTENLGIYSFCFFSLKLSCYQNEKRSYYHLHFMSGRFTFIIKDNNVKINNDTFMIF